MNLADARLKALDNPSLSAEQRALIRCGVAADLMHAGQYEGAREALGELWLGVGQRPPAGTLPPAVEAEVLLQCGTLTGLLGGALNVAGAQEQAKDMLSEALRLFRSQGNYRKVAEAQCELGACYWRLGAHDEARIVMREALASLADDDTELKARILIRSTLVEISENRYHDALAILAEAEPVFASASDALKGRWHGQRGLILRRLATAERREDYADRAVIEFTAAIFHYEQAGHERYCARNLNNLAMLLYKLRRYADAHEHLDRAQLIFTRLKDTGSLAQIDETRARVLVAERRYRDAERIIGSAVKTFETSGETGLLADALIVQGVVWSRLGAFDDSMTILRRAMKAAQDSGALAQAGQAALSLVEEHGATRRIAEDELGRVYALADELLRGSQDAEDIERLRACARIVIKRLSSMDLKDRNFSFYTAVREYEARLIEQALAQEGGSVSRAARLLGLTHQSLGYMLTKRHKQLAGKRTPRIKRLRSIIKESEEEPEEGS